MPVLSRRKVADATVSKEKGFGLSSKKQNGSMGDHSSKSTPADLDLTVVDKAFGKHADLYEDVLQVTTNASQEEIQLAYFDRRSELFTILAKIDAKPESESMVSQRYMAERKMDSVVLAVRILGDPALRVVYDRVRSKRLKEVSTPSSAKRRSSYQAPRIVTPAAAAEDRNSDVYDTRAMEEIGEPVSVEVSVLDLSPGAVSPNHERKKRSKNHHKSPKHEKSKKGHSNMEDYPRPPHQYNHHDRYSFEDPDVKADALSEEEDNKRVDRRTKKSDVATPADDLSVATESRQEEDTVVDTLDSASAQEQDAVKKSSGMFSCITGSRIFRKISDEISGACEDTLVSVDQVFNAFTLTDKDIKAVTKKIHKAQRQLDT
jgi:hypothetical protein